MGSNYSIAEGIALKEAEKPGIGFLSPYDHPEVWYRKILTKKTIVYHQLATKFILSFNYS